MSEDRKHIRDRFSGFEPEVDESAVEKGWEKIRYFLPQEKKRRAAFLWWRNGRAKLMGLAAVVIVAGMTAFLLWPASTSELTSVAAARNGNADATLLPANEKSAQQPQKETGGISIPSGHEQEASPVPESHLETLIQNHKPASGQPKNESAQPQQASAARKSDAAKSTAPLVLKSVVSTTDNNNNNNNTERRGKEALDNEVPGQQDKEEMAMKMEPLADTDSAPGSSDTLPYVLLTAIPATITYTNPNTLRELPLARPPGPPPVRRWSVELLAGAALASTTVQAQVLSGTSKANPQPLAGFGMYYRLRSRWYLGAQLRAAGNMFEQSGTSESQNRVVNRQLTVNSAIPSLIPDTLIYYIKIAQEKKLRSTWNYYAGAGLKYVLLRRGAWELEAEAMMSWRYTKYELTSQEVKTSDTLRYLRTTLSGRLPNQAPPPVDDLSSSQSLISAGVTPGLAACYRLNRRLSLLVKPSVFFQFKPLTIQGAESIYTWNQRQFFLDLGLRVNL